jgi:hypothetical protein
MSSMSHTVSTPELMKNLKQTLLHTRLLQQVAQGSFFIVDSPLTPAEHLTIAGCVEMANEQATALARAAAAPDIKGKDKKKQSVRK